jgi:O-antigen/teichoic acid export membrane protein
MPPGGARLVARNTAVQVVGDTAGKLISLAFYVVLARALGPDGFGLFTFGLSLALLVVTPAGFGIDTIVAREIARDRQSMHRLVWNALAMKAAFGVLAVAITIAIAALGGYGGSAPLVIALLAVAAFVELMAKTLYSVFLGLEDMRPPSAALLLQRIATAVFGILAVFAGAGVVTVAALYLAGVMLAFTWTARRVAAQARPRRSFDFASGRSLLVSSLPSGINVLLSTVLFRVDMLILSLLVSTFAVGLYGAAYRLLESTLVLSYAVAVAMLPTLSRLTRSSVPSLAEAYEGAAKVIAITLLPVGCVFALFAGALIEALYGVEYASAASALRLLGGAAALYGVSHLGLYVLISQSRQRTIPWITAGVVVLNVSLNLLLIPRFSIDAAAFVTSLSELTLAILMTVAAVRVSGPLSARRILVGPLAGAAAMGAAALVAGTGLGGLGLALLAYPLTLFLVERRLHPGDLRLILDVVRRPQALTPETGHAEAGGTRAR